MKYLLLWASGGEFHHDVVFCLPLSRATSTWLCSTYDLFRATSLGRRPGDPRLADLRFHSPCRVFRHEEEDGPLPVKGRDGLVPPGVLDRLGGSGESAADWIVVDDVDTAVEPLRSEGDYVTVNDHDVVFKAVPKHSEVHEWWASITWKELEPLLAQATKEK